MSAAASSNSGQKGNAGALPACGFSVHGTKNGTLPIKVEKRPKGKKVTIISNVQGSAKALLSALSSLLGCGGSLKQEASGQNFTLEVQGEQVERVSAALTQLGCLKGIKKEVEAKEKKKTTEVATRVCAYDKFLKRGEPDKSETKEPAEFSYSTVPVPGAECLKWHGPWIYCRGNCQQVDFSDVWEENLAGDEDLGLKATLRPASVSAAQLDFSLQSLGMLAEVGEAASSAGLAGKLLGGNSKARSKSRATSRTALRASSQPPRDPPRPRSCAPPRPAAPLAKKLMKPPPKVGHFACQFCGCAFGLRKTLSMHVRSVHAGMRMQPPSVSKGPQVSQWGPGLSPAAAAFEQAQASTAVDLLDGRLWTALPSSTKKQGPAATQRLQIQDIPGARPGEEETFTRIWNKPPPSESSQTEPATSRLQRAASRPRMRPAAELSTRPQTAHQPKTSPAAEPLTRPQTASQHRSSLEVREECPVCFQHFEPDRLESHVQSCVAKAAEGYKQLGGPNLQRGSVASGTAAARAGSRAAVRGTESAAARSCSRAAARGAAPETATSPARHVAIQDFKANGMNQLDLKMGMEVCLLWRQPREEGEYWAWVMLAGYEAVKGYVPLECLQAKGWPQMQAPQAPQKASGHTQSQHQSQSQSYSQSLQDTSIATAQERDVIPEDWLATFLELDLDGESAEGFWKSLMEYRAMGKPLEDAWLFAFNSLCDGPTAPALMASSSGATQLGGESEDEEEGGPRPWLQLPEGDVAGAELTLQVAEAWDPCGGSNQFSVQGGERFFVRWVQPEEEGGYWVWGNIEVHSVRSSPGYIPKHLLTQLPLEPTRVKESHALASSGSGRRRIDPRHASRSPVRKRQSFDSGPGTSISTIAIPSARASIRATPAPAPATEVVAAPVLVSRRWGKREAKACQPQTSTSALLGEEDRRWAIKTLAGLSARFNRDRIDPEVLLSILQSCGSLKDMMAEASASLADNQVVKQFIGNLWRRLSVQSPHGP